MKLLIVLMFMLVGCATTVRSYESKTDNIKHIELEPAWIADSMIRLGLHKTSSMPTDSVDMIVYVKGDTPASSEGLTINIDGQKQSFSSLDKLSDMDQYGYFYKRYPMKISQLKNMVAGKAVYVKVSGNSQSYQEGEFSKKVPLCAKDGFIKFLNQIGVEK